MNFKMDPVTILFLFSFKAFSKCQQFHGTEQRFSKLHTILTIVAILTIVTIVTTVAILTILTILTIVTILTTWGHNSERIT